MTKCFFVSDLHGFTDRYTKLLNEIRKETPDVVFFGGDLLPHGLRKTGNFDNFVSDFLIPKFVSLKKELKNHYPEIFLILGNDDFRSEEKKIIEAGSLGIWQYIHYKKVEFKDYKIFGYTYVPVTPFGIKDWEKYDIDIKVRPGCLPLEQGFRTVPPAYDIENSTIQNDINKLTKGEELSQSVFIFHSPPYNTYLDRAALDGLLADNLPMDVHVGSVAIRQFIEEKQPLLTLHGHIHESTRLTGFWKQQFGKTISINASHDGPELCIVKFDIEEPENATRVLL